jgi:hypothetical protein
MSLVDTTFASLPAGLLAQWGQDVTYVKSSTSPSYNTTTGEVNGVDTNVTVRALITEAKPEEFEGSYQTTDLKVIIGNAELGAYVPSVRDRIKYTQNSVTKTGRIISCKTVRGENPILHTILLRPQ